MELTAITPEGVGEIPGAFTASVAAEIITATMQLYRAVGYELPWIGYLAFEDGLCVGSCGFKSAPKENRVEIAYFTFPGHESKGVATRMAGELIRLAFDNEPNVIVAAQTLPERSASTSILTKLGFCFVTALEHPEDGLVWEWQLSNPADSARPMSDQTSWM
ncbi:MAG: [ribosomal protein S5]-alanine N-acetyltransferase [Acidobacteriota bacterium]|jgi:RimJ/RimL family protein N-acetyltransferase|nr:[ribosomal protein S5]-alanine N-acetyltransferase [Acidobacteriota bacterium]